eukprot:CAMPEP_0114338404 /NCGR_PEP_ID=MMETSP0101-20121206/7015_1 /TAXON_ID=38822 ORGANISM="Pteridomonas danica, Strain PT" /NCGR_SAMPLE_ID=MMETSP0101 /ASSEMBLY_ACC=CAM_ASM_000211 /LENGTH=62 /DNA_ID=CAMNT_0001470977 /DNA_START=480 /DNA_END=668 /DNA_ORIENTATION=-
MEEYWEKFGNAKSVGTEVVVQGNPHPEPTEENEKHEEDDITTSASDYSERKRRKDWRKWRRV